MKKILFISHDATRTGAPILLLNLAEALMANQNNKYVLSFLIKQPPYDLVDKFSSYPVKLATDNNYSIRKRLHLSKYSLRNIKNSLTGVDLIISNTLTNGDILPVIRKYFQGPVYSYIHELEMAAQYFTNTQDVNALRECTNHYLVPSLAVKKFLQESYSIADNNISLLQYYIPSLNNEIKKRAENNTLIIGGVGTIDWRKGPDLFIQVAYLTFQKKPDADIKFIWKGAINNIDLLRLQYDISKTGLKDKIEFQPASDDMQSFYKKIDVFLLTSREDPYPLVVLEAADAGVPTICFENAGGAPEFIHNSKAGVCVDYLDTTAMAASVFNYYENKEQKISEGKAAKFTLSQTHQNSSYIANQLEAIINNTSNNINARN